MEVKQLPLSSVFPSPMNPRKTFDEAAIQELADNIERQGLLQPITVRPVRHPSNEYGDRPDKYEIVCGERRYRALCERAAARRTATTATSQSGAIPKMGATPARCSASSADSASTMPNIFCGASRPSAVPETKAFLIM